MAFGWSLLKDRLHLAWVVAWPLSLEGCQALELVDLSLWNLEMPRLRISGFEWRQWIKFLGDGSIADGDDMATDSISL